MPFDAKWLRIEMPEVIIDANVIVSGTGNRKDSPPGRIVDAVVVGRLNLLASTELLAEYRRVLNRPRLQRVHRLEADELGDYLGLIAGRARVVAPLPGQLSCPDPGDQHLWDLLAAVPDAILVTGDRKLLESSDFPGRIISPRECVERFAL